MIQSIAFVAYAVSDVAAARGFYENILGLKLTRQSGGEWFEYDVGETTLAITMADNEHPAPIRGAALAFEVSDLETEIAQLKKRGARIKSEINDTPVCRFAVVLDPDGSEIIIHKRKE